MATTHVPPPDRRFVRPGVAPAATGTSRAAAVLDGLEATGPRDVGATLRQNASLVIPPDTIDKLVNALTNSPDEVFTAVTLGAQTGIGNVPSVVIHPAFFRACARAGIAIYMDEAGKFRKIQGASRAQHAQPIIKEGEIDAKFYLVPRWYETLRRFIDRGAHVLLIGPAGVGKSEAAEQVFAEREQRLEIISCTPSMDADDLEGKIDLKGGETVFTPSPVAVAVEKGYGLLVDEADAAPAEAAFAFYRVLDGKDMRIARKGFEGQIALHPEFRCIGTQNTEGRGDMNGLFHGRSLQDEAFLDRWAATIRVDYPEPHEEQMILCKRTGVPATLAEKVVESAKAMRMAAKEGKLLFTASMRRTMAVCHNLVRGDTPEDAWRYAAINRATKEDQDNLVEILKRVYGSRFSRPVA